MITGRGSLLSLTCVLLTTFVLAVRSEAQTEGIIFQVFEKKDSPLKWKDFRKRQENEAGKKGDNEALLDPSNLTTLLNREGEPYGLYSLDGLPTVDWPPDKAGAKVTLILAWPSAVGYSNLLLDLRDPSVEGNYPSSDVPIYTDRGSHRYSVIFNLLVAHRTLESLDAAIARRADPPYSLPYAPSPAFRMAYASARRSLREALVHGLKDSVRGQLGQESFEAAAKATLIMLEEYGVQFARARRPSFAPQWGVTFEGEIQQPGGAPAEVNGQTFQSVSRLVDCSRDDGWVRLVFDRNKSPDYYKPAIKWAHDNGLKVLGELLDSYSMCCTSKEQWEAHVRTYVCAFSHGGKKPDEEVDEWEVGNEVNGEWLVVKQEKVKKSGESCDRCTGYAGRADYIAYAADYVKKHSGKRTLLTLYWQVAEDKPSSSMFNWVRDVLIPASTGEGTSVKDLIDDVGISLYPDKTPMGLAFDRVFTTLREKYFSRDGQRVMVTELGYWPADLTEEDYEHIWRWGGADLKQKDERVRQGVRAGVAKLYQSAALGYPYSGGGAYWWYYLQEATPDARYTDNELWRALHSVHSAVADATGPCTP
ncbi:MAG: hypothetical protein JOZ02_12800 [Acidobacteria bacterium]|nr:hypothetical protein [Acidobacteriota bacterium]